MKKYSLICLFCTLFVFPFPAKCQEPLPLRRGLFVSVIQDTPTLSNRKEIEKLIDFAEKTRVRILFVQIYRGNKAWFASKVGDSEPYQTALKKISEDPFALLIREAHAAGIEVHAWLNLLSLSTNENSPLLKKYGPGILTRNLKEKKTIEDYKIDGQYFLEPGDPRVRKELLKMVGEILRAYPDLDGVQFDYIRYPDKNPAYGYTEMNIKRYKKATGRKIIEGGSRAWKDWKRSQVTGLLEQLVQKTRGLRPEIQISTTGCMPYIRAYEEAFQDWGSWLKRGLVDFVTVMSYPPDTPTFEKYVKEAKNKTGNLFNKINVGVGAYKLVHSPETFTRQFRLCEKAGGRACVIFHYGSLLENTALADPLTGEGSSGSAPPAIHRG